MKRASRRIAPLFQLLVATALTLAPGSARAMLINQLRPWSGNTGVGDPLVTQIELYNDAATSQSLSGWSLGGVTPADVVALPPWPVPPGAYLNVFFGPGTDDSDFSDGVGSFYLGVTSYGLSNYVGEVGLYNGAPSSGTIQDFVGYGQASGSFGFAYSNAIAAAMWPSGGFVDLTGQSSFAEIARMPSGYDRDTTSDWSEVEGAFVVPITNHHPMQLLPRDGTLQETLNGFSWRSVYDATDYLLEVDDDSLFGSPEVSVTVTTTSYTLPSALADGGYYWRVTPTLTGGPYPRAVWSFALTSTAPGPQPQDAQAVYGFTALPQYFQHKDSNLLCIWNTNSGVPGGPVRPGCTENAGAVGPWDGAHPVGNHILGCSHCNQYCTRASIQMINHKYGGTLLQDEISYQLHSTDNPGPEGDLGHNVGAWPSDNGGLSWALRGTTVAEKFLPGPPWAPVPFDSLSTEINSGRPVLTVIRPPGLFHSVVTNGYFQIFGFRFMYITDPWPGRTGWYSHSRMPVQRYYMIRPDTLGGRKTNPEVAADADADGVMNFDEGNPRPFASSKNSVDTDKDQVPDKEEIRQYTFHRNYHAGHINNALGFADVDGDGLRAEADCDSDNDGDFDGGEDVNGDGHFGAGETCVLRATSKDLTLTVSVAVCPGAQGTPELDGGTLHRFSNYSVDLQNVNCNPPAAGAALGAAAMAGTDATGTLLVTPFGCYPPGNYRMVVDAVANGTYDPGCDPIVCFTIDAAVASLALDHLDATAEPEGAKINWWVLERDAFEGFWVLRSTSGGPEVAVTKELIRNEAPTFPATFTWTDATVEEGVEYSYRIQAVQGSQSQWLGPVTLKASLAPKQLALRSAFPNPFANGTEIVFDLPSGSGLVRLDVYDLAGRRVKRLFEGVLPPSRQHLHWDGRDDRGSGVAAGVYFVLLDTQLGAKTHRVIKMR